MAAVFGTYPNYFYSNEYNIRGIQVLLTVQYAPSGTFSPRNEIQKVFE